MNGSGVVNSKACTNRHIYIQAYADVHACIHTHTRTYEPTYMHTYAYMHTYMHAYIHACIRVGSLVACLMRRQLLIVILFLLSWPSSTLDPWTLFLRPITGLFFYPLFFVYPGPWITQSTKSFLDPWTLRGRVNFALSIPSIFGVSADACCSLLPALIM